MVRLAAAILFATALSAASPSTQPAPAPPPPHLPIHLPPDSTAELTALSPDGHTAHLLVRARQLDVWRLLSHHWPEILGSLVLLPALRHAVRWLRRSDQDPL